ncbi:hypothetical protein BRADI_1g32671v3 [Brachypodium distachyon]|uniref:Uncharacterized protein n=1 Tax=Brachypodium distachyon TaxID=15368 RepID=A0A0Q3H2M2_BRADI|nr:hypothetical protein BRADI_1g32671v3 [Brachypodium distachyon]
MLLRSGSGWFETLLNRHENISSNGEIFSVKERRSNITSIMKTLDKLYNLDWFSSAAKNECTAAVGLKWMLNQGLMKHHQEIVEYFNRRGVSAIFLLRRNLLQRFVSILANDHDRNTKQLNGRHKAHVHHRGEADVLAEYKPTIITKSLIAELKRSDKLAADALVNFKTILNIVLYYEDVVSNRSKLTDVLDFLKLPKIKLSSRHVKIHTKRVLLQFDLMKCHVLVLLYIEVTDSLRDATCFLAPFFLAQKRKPIGAKRNASAEMLAATAMIIIIRRICGRP